MSVKIFEALIELQNDFGSGNDLQHNTRTNVVYRGKKYHDYKDELIEALYELNDKFKVEMEPEDELAVSLVFYQTNVNQLKRSTKDLDNMIKPTLDAMQEALGFDDAQITKLTGQKMTHFTRSLRIEIWKA
ncbi:RusA family crossover junction endodeoxyribonuclease [Weissella ceti]|uniref:RusA family crossover junction endodeoxyribonuclease n=1 Tax=Weissella ceti TaxID=759620 RepID=A0ABT3E3N3_9LACO|nr:RusA family crossover junction endodeoxyribonuclease [Weissella ceti]MCW0953024.1 RusA family crossover junction endodeoxyribonuclease [Weissella ceti]QVK11570.1 RusA family crossover junction endodeoxyribonuclease [Weissella ceti]